MLLLISSFKSVCFLQRVELISLIYIGLRDILDWLKYYYLHRFEFVVHFYTFAA